MLLALQIKFNEIKKESVGECKVPLFGCFFKPACLINRASCRKLPEQKLPNGEKQQTLQQPPIWSEAKFSKHSEHIHKHDDDDDDKEVAVYDS